MSALLTGQIMALVRPLIEQGVGFKLDLPEAVTVTSLTRTRFRITDLAVCDMSEHTYLGNNLFQ